MRVGDCQYGNKLKRARRADEELVEGDHAKRSDRRSHAEASPGWSAANHARGRDGLAEELLLQRAQGRVLEAGGWIWALNDAFQTGSCW